MSEKYLQEIEEILKEAEVAPPREAGRNTPPPQRGRHGLRPSQVGPSRGLRRISASKVMLAALAIFLIACIVSIAGGPTMLFVGFGLALFVIAYVMFFAGASGPTPAKRWRGRLMEDEPGGLWGRFKRWMKG